MSTHVDQTLRMMSALIQLKMKFANITMSKRLNLKESAKVLDIHPDTLRKKAAKGIIPGIKACKQWFFFEDDLAQYLRSLYSEEAKASWGDHRRKNQWHSIKETIYGGFSFHKTEREYKDLLGLRTKRQHKDCTTK